MNIDYQAVFDIFIDMLKSGLPIGTTLIICERIVQFFYCAVSDRWPRFFREV